MQCENSVIPFCFDSHEVRVITIDNEPWFVAADVCTVLEHSNPTMAMEMLDEDERAKKSLGRQGEAWIISESGLYTLIIRSNKPQAKPFRKWVTSEVLPSIRKTGTYAIPNRPVHVPLFPGREYAAAIAHTREGELLARELTVGIRIARACGMSGRRQVLEEGNALAAQRCGVDCLQYFDMSLEKLFPRLVEDAGPHQMITSFLFDEFNPDIAANNRMELSAVYERFKLWFAERVDNRARYMPSNKAMAKLLRENGIEIRPSGGKTWVYGLEVRS